ncbi:MAG: putative polyubiquitin Ubi4 [Streblomastix strix]|uniref:Putative polyubiquitin Ubi4 n=1 Tax=Streblomastix strix TaxID=222440 RepID=A0A5J4UXS2_9EUKA|nr:MAG: putative polyubiquitin Ubi4 [Streblomastix strix]
MNSVFQVYVELPDKQTISIFGKRDDFIDTVRNQIQDKANIPMDKQRLTFNGVELEDWKKLNDYNVDFRDTLKLEIFLDEIIKVYIKIELKKIIILKVAKSDRIEILKKKIEEKEGIPVKCQKLTFAGKQLKNERTIQEQNIERESTIQLVRDNEEQVVVDIMQDANVLSLLKSIPEAYLEKEKILKAKQICFIIDRFNEYEADSNINSQFCLVLKELIEDESFQVQNQLLLVVGSIVRLGYDIVDRDECNKFYKLFQQTQLKKTVDDVMRRLIKDEENASNNENVQYSDQVLQIVDIFSFINAYSNIGYYNSQACGKIFATIISQFLKKFKQNIGKKQIQQNKWNNEKEKSLIQVTQTLQSLGKLIRDRQNKDYLDEKFHLLDIIIPLIHVNCPPKLGCTQTFSLPKESPTTLQFHCAVYEALNGFAIDYRTIHMILEEQNQTDKHSIPLIIACTNFLKDQYSKSTHTIIDIRTLPSVAGILSTFFNIIQFWDKSQKTVSNLELVIALVQLSNLGRRGTGFKINEREEIYIRQWSNQCLYELLKGSDNKMMNQILIEQRYIQNLIEDIEIAGGIRLDVNKIYASLENIQKFFNIIESGRSKGVSKMNILQSFNESVEQDGGMEEIESLILVALTEVQFKNMKNQARYTKNDIMNIWKNPTNQR